VSEREREREKEKEKEKKKERKRKRASIYLLLLGIAVTGVASVNKHVLLPRMSVQVAIHHHLPPPIPLLPSTLN
jgi:cell division septal protein FtsQ